MSGTEVINFLKKKEDKAPRANWMFAEQKASNVGKQLFLYFEGNSDSDEAFYKNPITYFYREYKTITRTCKGKSQVYKTYQFDWNKNNKSLHLFFVDKDFDDFLKMNNLEDENIFTTKFYSIENYVVTEEVFRRVLKEMFGFEDGNILDNVATEYSKNYSEFQKMMILLSAWMLEVREQEILGFIPSPNFNGIKLSDYMEISSAFKFKLKFSKKDSIKKFYKDYSFNSKLKYKFILKKEKMLKEFSEPKIYIRGKQDLWFIIQAFDRVNKTTISEINASPENKKKLTSLPNDKESYKEYLKQENAMRVLGPRLSPPPMDLEDFIKRNYNKAEGINS